MKQGYGDQERDELQWNRKKKEIKLLFVNKGWLDPWKRECQLSLLCFVSCKQTFQVLHFPFRRTFFIRFDWVYGEKKTQSNHKRTKKENEKKKKRKRTQTWQTEKNKLTIKKKRTNRKQKKKNKHLNRRALRHCHAKAHGRVYEKREKDKNKREERTFRNKSFKSKISNWTLNYVFASIDLAFFFVFCACFCVSVCMCVFADGFWL